MARVDEVMDQARSFLRRARGIAEYRRTGRRKQLELPHIPGRVPLEKTIWGSPAGKKRLAGRLVKLIPPHKTYVEPFAGSGAVFFEKEPVEREVLSDGDPEIASAYKALKTLTKGELESLRKKTWVGSERTFRALQKANPKGKVDRLHRFLYLSHFSYGKLRGKSYNPNATGIEATTIARIEKFGERLKPAIVRSGHYVKVVREFDGKDTFFFLDPPYPGHDVEVGEDRFDEVEFRKVLESIKGKFLVTYGTRGKLDTKGFHVKKIRTPRTIRTMHGVAGPKTLPQLLIANYAITEKSIGEGRGVIYLDDVEAAFELDGRYAHEIVRAAELAKMLGEHHKEERAFSALAVELAKIEPLERPAEPDLAAELQGIALRLLPEVQESAPEIAGALEGVLPALDEIRGTVTKAAWTSAYINALPDSAFLYIEPGGEKDERGRTKPRNLRHFPVRDAGGKLDLPHLRNALARLPQSKAPGLDTEGLRDLMDRARRMLEEANEKQGKADRAPKVSKETEKVLRSQIPIFKTEEERFVLGVVLEPETVDAQKDIYSAAEVRDAAHRFMEEYRNVGLMHQGYINDRVKILESYVAPAAFEAGGQTVKKGTWLLAVRVLEDELWRQVKDGSLTGLSIGGTAAVSEESRSA